MLRWIAKLLLTSVCLLPTAVWAQPARIEALVETFFSPEMLLNHAQDLELTDEQKQSIEVQFRENRQNFVQMQQQLQQQMAALAEILHREQPDEQVAMVALDKVLGTEREIKRTQLHLSLVIRGLLTTEQLAKARELRTKFLAEARNRPKESMRAKMQQLQERIRQTQQQGGDPAVALRAVTECKRLMQQGKPTEAEAVLDRALVNAAQGSGDTNK